MTEYTVHFFIIASFVLGYLLIIFEQKSGLDKTGISLLMAVACWSFVFLTPGISLSLDVEHLQKQFLGVAEVTTFILVLLVIVEIVQTHEGFTVLTDKIHIRSKKLFFWTIGLITFFLSTMIANVTATIIMMALSKRFLHDKADRMVVGAGIIIASNAGGAWTPIGDITTTMLWIGKCVTTLPLMRDLFLPSLISMIIAFFFLMFLLHGNMTPVSEEKKEKLPYRTFILGAGIVSLILIPTLHYFFDFPPYMGGILGVGFLWIVTDVLYRKEAHLRVPTIMTRIDMSTYFFFLGILLAVRALDSAGILTSIAESLAFSGLTPNEVAIYLGLISAVVDNVPLVAASLGMYPLDQFPTDSSFWQLLAYCAGVGGSALLIGSPAGIAYMNIEKVPFLWYMKWITLPVLAGFFGGVIFYLFVW